jgi:DNA-binding transcriptional ArsR family regulator
VFGALGHETRRHVLLVLHARGGAMTAGALAERFECSWPTVTRHLQRLLEARLVTVERRGRERWYAIDRERLRRVTALYLAAFD